MVEIQDIERAVAEAKKENSLFANKAVLDAFVGAGRLAGREGKTGELVRALVGGLEQKYVPPFVFVYGRTGSGKSSIVKFVCDSLPVSYRIVNLRRAQTVFGCAGLILLELGVQHKSGQGIAMMLEKIEEAVEAAADGKKLFVLVLDEFDALFYDTRGRPSDLLYRLLTAQERLRERGRLVTIVVISNSVAAVGEMDDRVRSRMGSAPEIFFNAYSKEDVVTMLEERARAALAEGAADRQVIEYCAEQCSKEHGDARRAIDFLRAAAEIAGAKGERKITKEHTSTWPQSGLKRRECRRSSFHHRTISRWHAAGLQG